MANRPWQLSRIAFALALLAVAGGLRAASNDNNVEWNGVHSDETFRSPVHPARGESFALELQVFRGDITGARVRIYDGQVRHHSMVWVRNAGSANQYDIWRTTVTGTQSDFLYYRFEITDGSDTDYFNRLGVSGGEPGSGDFLINLTPLGQFPLGATIEGNGAVFRVWAPNASAVSVAGDFNGWNGAANPMTNVAGVWQTRISGALHGHEYKFRIENGGSHWRTDPRGRRHLTSIGNSVIWNPLRYEWGDTNWSTPSFQDMILYELHVGSFAGEGDGLNRHPAGFRDVVDRHLDHLVELGVNVIELMPVTEFAGDLSWGYNPAFQYSVESAHGTPDDLKYLVDRCHQAGLAVILDVVFNHMGPSDLAGNLLDYDGEEIYFYREGDGFRETPWGPRPDYGNREVRNYLTETIRYWIEEYHLDGFRLDGTAFIKVNTDGWRLLQDFARAADSVSRKAVITAEQLPNDPAVTQSLESGGAGLDAQWNDSFHDHLRAALNAAPFGDPDMGRLVEGMNHFAFGGSKAINYIESHDEAAVHGRAVVAADSADPHSVWAYGRGKLCYGLVMFTAGMPLVLQGQEWMEDRRFGDGLNNRIQWNYRERYHDYFLACRDMTWLRRRSPALRGNSSQNIFHLNESANVVAWHRWAGNGDDLVMVASFNNSDLNNYCLGMPLSGQWLEIFNSDAGVYGGRNHGNGGQIAANGGALHGLPYSACITIPRMGVLVFARQQIDLNPDLDADNDGLPNSWEREHGFDPNSAADALFDTDGDGLTNLEEYMAGTDPHSAASALRFQSITYNGADITLRWRSVAGKTYQVQASAGVTPPLWQTIGTVHGTGSDVSFSSSSPTEAVRRFYQIVVSP